MTLRELVPVLRQVAVLLDARSAEYVYEGRFRFELEGDWSLLISSDGPGRLRLDACYRSRRGSSLWCFADDRCRLAALVMAAQQETAALAA